jgi:Tfp pilus assembly protein PilO
MPRTGTQSRFIESLLAEDAEIERALRQEEKTPMRQNNRDPWTVATVVLSIVVQLAAWSYAVGKFETRLETAESAIKELQEKAQKDAAQDVQLATIAQQLANIQQGLVEIKSTLESKR